MRRNSYIRDEYYVRAGYRCRESRELLQCPVERCDGSGHVSGNFATHRRQAIIFQYSLIFEYSRIFEYSQILSRTSEYSRLHREVLSVVPCRYAPLNGNLPVSAPDKLTA
ncbi:uncharacterized protein LOC123723634 [Papilio machaon]|nr:uncharacterized protein LOC123723634 [Papilio machaon]